MLDPFIFLIIAPIAVFGTTILVGKKQGEVVIGADSLVARNGVPTGHMAKVIVADNCVFAASGSYYPEHGLDVFAIAKQASKDNGGLMSVVNAYIEAVMPPLQQYLNWDRANDTQHFGHLCKIGASEVAFINKQSLEVIRLWFPIDESGIVSCTILDRFDNLSGDQAILIPVGETTYARAAAQDAPEWSIDMTVSILKFLQLEVDANPSKVGPPLSILRLDGVDTKWID